MKMALALTYMVFAVLLNSVGTVILQSIQGFGTPKLDASLLEAFKDLSIVGASVIAASLVPVLGYRLSMIGALALVSCACVLMPILPSFHTTELLFATVGVSFAITKIALYSSVGLLTNGRSQHASLTNLIEGMFMVGMLSGYWLFSAFIDTAGGPLAWLDVYWVLAGVCVVAMVLLATSPLDESGSGQEARAGSAAADEAPVAFERRATVAPHRLRRVSWAALRSILAKPLVYVFLCSAFLYVLIEQSVGTWLPTFNREVLRLPNVTSVEIASIFAGMLAIGRLGAGFLLRRVSWYALLNACVLAMAALIVLTLPLAAQEQSNEHATLLSAPAAAYLFPLFGLFMAPIYPVINSVALSAAPQRIHATMTGLIVVFSALGGTSGSRITAIVFARYGGERAFYFTLIPAALLLAVLYLFKRQAERSAAETAARSATLLSA